MKRIDLNGEWKFGKVGDLNRLNVKVPGTVYSGLIENKKIDNPYYGTNSKKLLTYAEFDYEFEKSFELDDSVLESKQILLCADGLDTICDIYVNGSHVAYCDNMHIGYTFDIKAVAKSENTIKIIFFSPMKYVAEKQKQNELWSLYHCHDGFAQIRKAHSMFGWDWAPKLPDMGIYRDIYVKAYNYAQLGEIHVRQNHTADEVILNVEVPHKLLDNQGCETSVTLISPDGAIIAHKTEKSLEGNNFRIAVKNPELWWPNGYGKQPLYKLNVQVCLGENVIDEKAVSIGLRTVTISCEKDEIGSEFAIKINGIKIFAKGGCYVPEDAILTHYSDERTYKLLKSAKEANFNIVRIWGGGIYPSDYFFDVCDKLGLLVWEDFMFACAIYDFNEEFTQNICHEIEYNVKRIRNHPSLALWCGNNEIEDAWLYWDCIDDKYKTDEVKEKHVMFFEKLIPDIINKYDPDTFYWSSSPSSGESFNEARDETRGDVHYWGILDNNEPIEIFGEKKFRFLSEFGVQSFPCIKTAESFLSESERNIFSEEFEWHQKHSSTNAALMKLVFDEFKYPKNFESVLYASQLMQGKVVKYVVEHLRSLCGICMGTMYWQLNDCWPVTSWASIDYYGRWKALQYFAKRFYAPVIITCQQKDKIAEIVIANDTSKSISGYVQWSVRHKDGEIIKSGNIDATVLAQSGKKVCDLNLADILADEEICKNCFFEVCFISDNKVVCENIELFVKNKRFNYSKPTITCNLKKDGSRNVITVKSDTFAKYVELGLYDNILSDNYFDLLPGVEKVVYTDEEIPEAFEIKSVYDID